jgi:hypothetical protein
MIVDCECCEVRGLACGDCVIGVLLGPPAPVQFAGESGGGTAGESCNGAGARPDVPSGAPIVHLDAPERRAIELLADQGLIPRLRLVAGRPRRATDDGDAGSQIRDAG